MSGSDRKTFVNIDIQVFIDIFPMNWEQFGNSREIKKGFFCQIGLIKVYTGCLAEGTSSVRQPFCYFYLLVIDFTI